MVLSLQIILLDLRPSVHSIYCPDDSSSPSCPQSPSFLFNEPTSFSLRVLSLTKLPTVAFFPVTKRALDSHVAPRALRVAGPRATIRFDVLGPIAILARLARFLPELHVAMAHKPLLEFPAGAYEYEYHYEPAHAYHLTLCTRSHQTLMPKSSVSRTSVLPSVESGLLGRSSLLSA